MRRPHLSELRSPQPVAASSWAAGCGAAGVLLCALFLGSLACEKGETPPEPAAPSSSAPREAAEAHPWRGRPRPAVHAGSWYPADARALRREIETRIEAQQVPGDAAPILAMIGPHAGLQFSGSVAAAGHAALARQAVSRVFLLGPAHYAHFSGIALPAPDLESYATPLGELAIDREAIAALRGQPGFGGPPAAQDPEHSLEMHAIFLAALHPQVQLVPLVLGGIGDAAQVRSLASRLRELLRPGDVVIASSDFTHYGPSYRYVPFREGIPEHLEELLQGALTPLSHLDLEGFDRHLSETGDTICGRQPLRLLLALLPADATAQKLAADTSGRLTGSYRNSVSYLAMVFRGGRGWPPRSRDARFEQGPEVLGPGDRELALQIARTTLELYLERGRTPGAAELGVPSSGPLRETLAAFVTLKRRGALRGCIGHIFPVEPLWRSIRDNAIAAAVKDTRFSAVTADELGDLELEISVLTRPRGVGGPEEFEVGRHGVVLRANGRRAVFLPQVAPEQGWDRDTTLSHLARKAGLSLDAWRSPAAALSVFEAQVITEAPTGLLEAREAESARRGFPRGQL